MHYFECKRCEYCFIKRADMVAHLNRKKKCEIKNMFNTLEDDELERLSLIEEYDEKKINELYVHRCQICERKFIDNPHKEKHEKTCLKRKNKFNLTNEEIQLKYKKIYKKNIGKTPNEIKEEMIENNKLKNRELLKQSLIKQDIKNNVQIHFDNKSETISKTEDEYENRENESEYNKDILKEFIFNQKIEESIPQPENKGVHITQNITQNIININYNFDKDTIIQIIPFDLELDFSHLTEEEKIDITLKKDYDGLIKRLLENPVNQNILFNDTNKKNVVVFRSYDKGFEKTDFKMVLDKYSDDTNNIISSFLNNKMLFGDYGRTFKLCLGSEIKEKHEDIKKKIKKKEYRDSQYESLQKLVPNDQKIADNFKFINDNRYNLKYQIPDLKTKDKAKLESMNFKILSDKK